MAARDLLFDEPAVRERAAIGSRFWATTDEDLQRLEVFLRAANSAADRTFLIVNQSKDKVDTAGFVEDLGLQSVQVQVMPYGESYAAPLNKLLQSSCEEKFNHLLLASVEIPPERQAIRLMQNYLVANTVYVGGVLPGHSYKPGNNVRANALQTPWNTFALLNALELSKTGIPPTVDGDGDPAIAGMEEVVTLARQEALGNTSALIRVPGLDSWPNMHGWSEERKRAHHEKMESKVRRANIQLELLGLQPPLVRHELDPSSLETQLAA